MSFEDSEKTSRVTLQQHYNFVMNQVVSITYDLWHIIFMKILLIEDNQRTQEWVTQGLSEAGYVIDAVSDGRDGLYLALKDDYALIILDIMLPGMDGWTPGQIIICPSPLKMRSFWRACGRFCAG